jgi:hypothetical protein
MFSFSKMTTEEPLSVCLCLSSSGVLTVRKPKKRQRQAAVPNILERAPSDVVEKMEQQVQLEMIEAKYDGLGLWCMDGMDIVLFKKEACQ